MAYRSKQMDTINSKLNKNETNNYQKKFEQMSKQQQIIEQKKLEIQLKLEEKKRKETEEALKKLNDKTKEPELGKRAFGSSHTRHQSWRGNDRWRRQQQEEKSVSTMPTNIFSNDGSFLDQFQKLSGIKVPVKIIKDLNDDQAKSFENENNFENKDTTAVGATDLDTDKEAFQKQRRWQSPTRDRSRSPPKVFVPHPPMPPMMYPQPPLGMSSMLMQPNRINYQQTYNPMQYSQAPQILPSSIPPPAPINPGTIPSPSPLQPYSIPPPLPIMPHSIPQPSPMVPQSIPQPSPMVPHCIPQPSPLTPHSIPPPLPLMPHSIPPPINQPPAALFLAAPPPPPPPPEPKPESIVSGEQPKPQPEIKLNVISEPILKKDEPFREDKQGNKSLEQTLSDSAPPENGSSAEEEGDPKEESEDEEYSGGELFTVTPPPKDYWQEEAKSLISVPPPLEQGSEATEATHELQVKIENPEIENVAAENLSDAPPTKKKRRSRWASSDETGDKESVIVMPNLDPTNVIMPSSLSAVNNATPIPVKPLSTTAPFVNVPGMSGAMISMVSRTEPGLLQYAVNAFGRTNLTEEEWKTAEDHFKINLLYQDMMRKKEELKKLEAAGKNKYEYDSDEEIDGGTWEHKLREKEMEATQLWAEELTEKAKGKHHIGDFLPPDELARFMEKYEALKQGRPPDLSDYKEFKLKEDNIGFQMLQKLGWTEGQGLGSDGSGILDPVNKAAVCVDNQGLGVERPDDVSQGDDEYDAYRKRMMLAYRFRPNPMNNPRRPYY